MPSNYISCRLDFRAEVELEHLEDMIAQKTELKCAPQMGLHHLHHANDWQQYPPLLPE